MVVLMKLVCISWISLVFIALRTVGTEYRVDVKQIMGELFGQAVLKCTFNSPGRSVLYVQWFDATETEIYFDTTHPNPNTKPGPGNSFKDRNITGAFKRYSHELKIDTPLITDGGLYQCKVGLKLKTSIIWYSGYGNLTLVAPTDSPPSITDVRGVKVKTSNCSDSRAMPIKYVSANTSFVCRVGGSTPGPSVEWYHNGGSRTHTQISSTYSRRGVSVKNASRQIDVLTSNSSIRCAVLIPDVRSGALQKKQMCLRIVFYNGISSSLRSNQSLVIGLSVGLPVVLVLLSLSIFLAWKYKTKWKAPSGYTPTNADENLNDEEAIDTTITVDPAYELSSLSQHKNMDGHMTENRANPNLPLLANDDQKSKSLKKIHVIPKGSEATDVLKVRLATLCYPFNWNLEMDSNKLKRVQRIAKKWTTVDCQKQSLAAKVIVAYTTFMEGERLSAMNQLKEIAATPQHLPALAFMAHIHYQEGNYTACKEQLDLIDKECTDTSVSEARYAKAFAFIQVSGSICNEKAYEELKELHEKDPSHPVVLLNLIFTMCRLVRLPDTTESRRKELGLYVLKALELKNVDQQMIFSHILRLDVASRSTPAGKKWMDRFISHNRYKIKLDEYANFRPRHPPGDVRNLHNYTCRISYYDKHTKFKEASNVSIEAICEFPNDNFIVARHGISYLENAKNIFRSKGARNDSKETAKDRVPDYVLLHAIEIFESLVTKDWYKRYEMFEKLGTAYYINNQHNEAYRAFKQAIKYAKNENIVCSDAAQIHVNWCKILQMCSKADCTIPFSHARASVHFEDNSIICHQKIKAMRDALRQKLNRNKTDLFYILLNGYLEMYVSLREAERLFNDALSQTKNWDTYIAMTELYFRLGQIPRAKEMLAKAEKCQTPIDDEAFKDHNAEVKRCLDMGGESPAAWSGENPVQLQNRESGQRAEQRNWVDALETECLRSEAS